MGLPDPLVRLHQTAMRLGITVLDEAAAGGWPDENTAAIVSFGEYITLKPGLDDDLRTDVLAMALIVAAVMGDRPTGHRCAITAPDGLVVISRTRVARPRLGPGRIATLLARACGRDTESAAFEYTTPGRGGSGPAGRDRAALRPSLLLVMLWRARLSEVIADGAAAGTFRVADPELAVGHVPPAAAGGRGAAHGVRRPGR